MKALIVAAHPDDELLGLGRLLHADRSKIAGVVYVNNSPVPARLAEAKNLAKWHGYKMWAVMEDYRFTDRAKFDTVFLPAPTDGHAEHQIALNWGLDAFNGRAELMEYSIEKNAPYVTPLDEWVLDWKRKLFANFFPSQKTELLDPKYFLFEGCAPLGVPSITVRFREPGFHFWKGAPPEVAFLRHEHRHMFGVALTLKNLTHHDRQQEFFLVQSWAQAEFRNLLIEARRHGRSCEWLARALAVRTRINYGTAVTVEIDEDNENSASVTI